MSKVFRKRNDQEIFETWAPQLAKYGVSAEKDEYKAQWIAEYCHNVASWANAGMIAESTTPGLFYNQPGSLMSMGNPVAPTPTQTPFYGGVKQSVQSNSGSGDKFPSLMPVAIQVAAKTIAFDLVGVIPMDAPVGFIPYLDYVYAGGDTTSTYPPFLIKLSKQSASTVTDGSPTKTWANMTIGAQVLVKASSTLQATLKLVGFSRIDGSVVLGVVSMESVVANLAAAFVAGNTLNIDGYVFTLTANNNTIELVSALENQISGFTSTPNMNDTWSGNYLPDGIDQNVNPATNGIPDPMERATGETAMFRQMGLKMFTKFIEAKTEQVAISATVEQIQDLNRVWNFDVISMLENVGVNEIAQNINKRIMSRLMQLGYNHAQEITKVEGSDLTTLTLAASGSFDNTATLQRRLVTKMLEMAQLLYHRNRWGAGEFIVTNGRVAAAIADSSGYTFQTSPVKGTGVGQLYPAGEVYGLKIYVDPNLKFGDSKILIGRKGKDEEPGLKFMPYIMAESLQTISEGTMSPKIGVKSRYGMEACGWHPETMYVTLEVSNLGKLTGSIAPAA